MNEFQVILQLGTGIGTMVVFGLWMTKTLVPRLQDDAAKARAEFLEQLKADRAESREERRQDREAFLSALVEERKSRYALAGKVMQLADETGVLRQDIRDAVQELRSATLILSREGRDGSTDSPIPGSLKSPASGA